MLHSAAAAPAALGIRPGRTLAVEQDQRAIAPGGFFGPIALPLAGFHGADRRPTRRRERYLLWRAAQEQKHGREYDDGVLHRRVLHFKTQAMP